MRWLLLAVFALASCDRALGLERDCDGRITSECAMCGGIGQACCPRGDIACGDGLFCGDGTCNECVLDVGLGRRHMCSVRYDGTVWCAGQNETGQRGQSGSDDRTAEPVQVAGLTDVVSIGAGRSHTCAVHRDSGVSCWGRNSQGQLGNGMSAVPVSAVPTRVLRFDGSALRDIVAVRAGYCHTCALDRMGGVACWGCGSQGELGNGASGANTLAVTVLSAGAGSPPLTGVVELTVGHEHTCARTQNGDVLCWGDNESGQLGNGQYAIDRAQPVKVLDAATSVSAGSMFTCATKRDGTAWCWGRASGSRLGDGDDELPVDKDIPTQVVSAYQGPGFTGATKVSVGTAGCLVTEDTGVWCWGNDVYGTTGGGGGSTVPAPVIDVDGNQLAGVDRLIGHYAHTCAHESAGRFTCWGRNTSGELANGTLAHTGAPATVKLTCP